MVNIFRGDLPNPIQDVIIPGSGDNNFRQMVVVQPFVDPPNSFRAQTVSDMFFITPERMELSTLEFDVGLDPKIEPIIFSIQNRCLNITLRVNLRLPQFLRSNLGNEFLIPAIGDTDTPPIFFFNRDARIGPAIGEGAVFDTVSDSLRSPVGAGKGLVNVIFTFSETQAKTLNPNIYAEKITFDIFPNDTLTGPVFVSTVIGKPLDLNESGEEFPIDDNEPIVTGSVEPPIAVITQSIEVEKLVPTLAPGFIPGADGVTNDGVVFTAGEGPVAGPPPTGWTTEADGRAYPPIILDPVCDPVTGEGPDGIKLEDIPEDQLTPLQKLLRDTKDVPRTFGSLTQRRGFLIEPRSFLRGNVTNISTVVRLSPQVVVADSIPGRTDFKIIAADPVFQDAFTVQVTKELNATISAVKEGEVLGTVFVGGELRRLFSETSALKKILEDGDRFEIKNDQNTPTELQIARVVGPAASILFNLKNEGAGS